MSLPRRRADIADGQALVEFALSIIIFLVLLMAIFDFGRGIFMYNGVSQAAREIARAEIIKQGNGTYSTQTQQVILTQKTLVPGLQVDDPKCVTSADATDGSATAAPCDDAHPFLVVTAHASYKPVSLLGFLGTINVQAKSREQLPSSQNK